MMLVPVTNDSLLCETLSQDHWLWLMVMLYTGASAMCRQTHDMPMQSMFMMEHPSGVSTTG